MGLEIQQILIGQGNSFLECCSLKKTLKDGSLPVVFMTAFAIDDMLKKSGSNLISFSNIGYINENSFENYGVLRKNKYDLKFCAIPYGVGSNFNVARNKNFSLITYEKALVNEEPIFKINNAAKKMLPSFSENVRYSLNDGFCGLNEFDFKKYLNQKNEKEFFETKIIALSGHCH